jgi:hypothetical protein
VGATLLIDHGVVIVRVFPVGEMTAVLGDKRSPEGTGAFNGI